MCPLTQLPSKPRVGSPPSPTKVICSHIHTHSQSLRVHLQVQILRKALRPSSISHEPGSLRFRIHLSKPPPTELLEKTGRDDSTTSNFPGSLKT